MWLQLFPLGSSPKATFSDKKLLPFFRKGGDSFTSYIIL